MRPSGLEETFRGAHRRKPPKPHGVWLFWGEPGLGRLVPAGRAVRLGPPRPCRLPRQCHIAVVLATAASHCCGCRRPVPGDGRGHPESACQAGLEGLEGRPEGQLAAAARPHPKRSRAYATSRLSAAICRQARIDMSLGQERRGFVNYFTKRFRGNAGGLVAGAGGRAANRLEAGGDAGAVRLGRWRGGRG
jgi:hypothetical protein